jgi:hypothetical protein
LDSAGYGACSIAKSISIIAPAGVYAGISVFSGDGIDVSIGASDSVTLRGLTVNNQGSTGSGIVLSTGGTLHIDSCVVNGFAGTSGMAGILLQTSSGTPIVEIDQVRLVGNQNGLLARDGCAVSVRNSVATENVENGFAALTATDGASVELNIENCVATKNGTGVRSDIFPFHTGSPTVRLSNSTITKNNTGLFQDIIGTCLLLTRGNNTVEGNSNNSQGNISSYSAK